MRILVTTNDFLVGGRETYVATYLDRLRSRGWRADLLAARIAPGMPELSQFETVVEADGPDRVVRWSHWLDAAESFARARPAVVWAQHYDLLPAWLVSTTYGIPMVVTFHGPLVGAGRPNAPDQALGMTLALHRGGTVGAVSEEIVEGIAALAPDRRVQILPNAVALSDPDLAAKRPAIPKRFLLVTRPEKLEHIRLACLLFAGFVRRGGGTTLTIVSGARPDRPTRRRRRVDHVREALRMLGARWCLSQGASFLRALPRIRVHGYASDPRGLMRESDVVMGMGRVILEALAESRPAVLIGYDRMCGPVTERSFDRYRRANFSGRGEEPRSVEAVKAALLELWRGGGGPSARQLDVISVEGQGDLLHALLGRVVEKGGIADRDRRLADHLVGRIRSGASEEELFAIVCDRMSSAERKSFYRLLVG